MTKALSLPTASFIIIFLLGILFFTFPQAEAQHNAADTLGAATGQAQYLQVMQTGPNAASAWYELQDRARYWARLAPAGTLSQDSCTYNLQVADNGRTVATLSGAELEAACQLNLHGTGSGPVIINVTGVEISWPAPKLNLGAVAPEQLLFNFPEATALDIGAGDLAGTLLAPFASVRSHAVRLTGSLVGTELIGDIAIQPAPFHGEMPQLAYDFGDLPDSGAFGTVLAADGARHAQVDSLTLFLGQDVDTETDGQPDLSAWGDGQDETGVLQSGAWQDGPAGGGMDITIGAGDGCLNGWFDLNENGQFDDDEHLLANMVVSADNGGHYQTAIDLPQGTILNPTMVYARFRLTPQSDGACTAAVGPTGYAYGGEVEDYFWPSNPEPTALNWTGTAAVGLLQSPLLPALLLVSIMMSIMLMVGITILKGREGRKLRQ